MRLQGQTRLEFIRDGKVIKRVEKHNAITPFLSSAISAGNFHSLMSNSKIMPLTQWFDGCILTDKENTYASATGMIDYDSEITACAGSSTQTGTLANNSKLGVFQDNASGMTADGKGYQFVWEWGTAYGNGDIKSVCLTRAGLAIADLLKADETTRICTLPNYEVLGSQLINYSTIGANTCQIIDYKNGRMYYLSPTVSSETITIDEYDISTHYLKVNGEVGLPLRKIGSTHSFTNLTGITFTNCSANFTGSAIRLFWTSGANIYETTIDISTWTMSAITTHTYSGATYYTGGNYVKKDKFPLKNGYLYLLSGNQTKIYKCDLSSTDIDEIDNPLYSLGLQTNTPMGASVTLANGDIYWGANYNETYALYLHNDEWYAVRNYIPASSSTLYGLSGSNMEISGVDTPLGTVVGAYYDRVTLEAIGNQISTVNNLGQTYTKNSSMSMRLIYTITEV